MSDQRNSDLPESIFSPRQAGAYRWLLPGTVVLAVNTVHLIFSGRPDALTALMVGLHVLLGVLVGAALVAFGWVHFVGARRFPNPLRRRVGLFSLLSLSVCLVSGVTLLFTGAFGPGQAVLTVHLISGATGLGGLVLHFAVRLKRDIRPRWPQVAKGVAGVTVIVVGVTLGGEVWRYAMQRPEGEARSFFPTAATTANERQIPAGEIMNSASCGTADCHRDIYEQWFSSSHHYGSFSNPFYRRNVEYFGERFSALGDAASQFCGGCHDPAPTFSGKMSAFLDPESPLADAGVSCVGCHSIVKTAIIGNGSYVIERPSTYPFAYSPDRRLQALNHFLIKMKPRPHRKTFMKGFHKDNSEFCAVCHKVNIPKVVNQFRWVRGFNDYDAWQQSSWSGEAATSFYDAEESKTCQGCHMEETPSDDAVERKHGFVHDHRFLGSNTVLPLLKGDQEQFRLVEQFLTDPEDRKVTVDIFAAGSGQRFGEAGSGEGTAVVAPLNRGGFSAVPGEWLRLDVVVRNRAVGHNFPAGTTDLWSVWLELRVTDSTGRVIFHSGDLNGGPEGEVDRQAHFFRVLPLDELGQRIDKGNRWDTRTNLYNSTIPPGTADVCHYRFRVPEEAEGPLVIEGRLNYRKYRHFFANWVFGGRPAAAQEELMTVTSDAREWIFEEKPIPLRPIITLARDSVSIPIGGSQKHAGVSESSQEDFLRFNDYGIALLRQQDLVGARDAFQEVVRLTPGYADGHVNLARVYIATGDFADAEETLARALELKPGFLKARYFRALVHFRLGRFDQALPDFEVVSNGFPRDRQVLFQMGRALYVKGDYLEAVKAFEGMLRIDPEDARAHYNLMLCYRQLGQEEKATHAEEKYETYRLDYDIKRVTGVYRNLHPQESREGELVHEHSN